MTVPASLITHPISLCAYVLSLVFGLLAKMWNSKRNTKAQRQFFRLAVFLSITALVGGLALAGYQTSHTASSQKSAESAVTIQTTSGNGSSNYNNVGSVTNQNGTPPEPPPKPPEKKQ